MSASSSPPLPPLPASSAAASPVPTTVAAAAAASAAAATATPSATTTPSASPALPAPAAAAETPAETPRAALFSYADDGATWRIVEPQLAARLPFRNVLWQSPLGATPERRFLDRIDVQFRRFTPDLVPRTMPGGLATATFFVHLFVVSGEDVDVYRASVRRAIQAWAAVVAAKPHAAWYIVHVSSPEHRRSNAMRFLTVGGGVFDKIRSDFSGKRERCLAVKLSGNDAKDADAWNELMDRLKDGMLAAFQSYIVQTDHDARRLEGQRAMPGWNFCQYFLQRESVIYALELLGMHDDVFEEYEQLEQAFFQSMEQQGAPWFSKFGGSAPGDEAGDILDVRRKPYRQAILNNTVTIFDFRIYLFVRQIAALLETGKLARVCEHSLQYMALWGKTLREYQTSLMPGFAEIWTWTVCHAVIQRCDDAVIAMLASNDTTMNATGSLSRNAAASSAAASAAAAASAPTAESATASSLVSTPTPGNAMTTTTTTTTAATTAASAGLGSHATANDAASTTSSHDAPLDGGYGGGGYGAGGGYGSSGGDTNDEVDEDAGTPDPTSRAPRFSTAWPPNYLRMRAELLRVARYQLDGLGALTGLYETSLHAFGHAAAAAALRARETTPEAVRIHIIERTAARAIASLLASPAAYDAAYTAATHDAIAAYSGVHRDATAWLLRVDLAHLAFAREAWPSAIAQYEELLRHAHGKGWLAVGTILMRLLRCFEATQQDAKWADAAAKLLVHPASLAWPDLPTVWSRFIAVSRSLPSRLLIDPFPLFQIRFLGIAHSLQNDKGVTITMEVTHPLPVPIAAAEVALHLANAQCDFWCRANDVVLAADAPTTLVLENNVTCLSGAYTPDIVQIQLGQITLGVPFAPLASTAAAPRPRSLPLGAASHGAPGIAHAISRMQIDHRVAPLVVAIDVPDVISYGEPLRRLQVRIRTLHHKLTGGAIALTAPTLAFSVPKNVVLRLRPDEHAVPPAGPSAAADAALAADAADAADAPAAAAAPRRHRFVREITVESQHGKIMLPRCEPYTVITFHVSCTVLADPATLMATVSLSGGGAGASASGAIATYLSQEMLSDDGGPSVPSGPTALTAVAAGRSDPRDHVVRAAIAFDSEHAGAGHAFVVEEPVRLEMPFLLDHQFTTVRPATSVSAAAARADARSTKTSPGRAAATAGTDHGPSQILLQMVAEGQSGRLVLTSRPRVKLYLAGAAPPASATTTSLTGPPSPYVHGVPSPWLDSSSGAMQPGSRSAGTDGDSVDRDDDEFHDANDVFEGDEDEDDGDDGDGDAHDDVRGDPCSIATNRGRHGATTTMAPASATTQPDGGMGSRSARSEAGMSSSPCAMMHAQAMGNRILPIHHHLGLRPVEPLFPQQPSRYLFSVPVQPAECDASVVEFRLSYIPLKALMAHSIDVQLRELLARFRLEHYSVFLAHLSRTWLPQLFDAVDLAAWRETRLADEAAAQHAARAALDPLIRREPPHEQAALQQLWAALVARLAVFQLDAETAFRSPWLVKNVQYSVEAPNYRAFLTARWQFPPPRGVATTAMVAGELDAAECHVEPAFGHGPLVEPMATVGDRVPLTLRVTVDHWNTAAPALVLAYRVTVDPTRYVVCGPVQGCFRLTPTRRDVRIPFQLVPLQTGRLALPPIDLIQDVAAQPILFEDDDDNDDDESSGDDGEESDESDDDGDEMVVAAAHEIEGDGERHDHADPGRRGRAATREGAAETAVTPTASAVTAVAAAGTPAALLPPPLPTSATARSALPSRLSFALANEAQDPRDDALEAESAVYTHYPGRYLGLVVLPLAQSQIYLLPSLLSETAP